MFPRIILCIESVGEDVSLIAEVELAELGTVLGMLLSETAGLGIALGIEILGTKEF